MSLTTEPSTPVGYSKMYEDHLDPILARIGVTLESIKTDGKTLDNGDFSRDRKVSVSEKLGEMKEFLRTQCKVLVVGAGGLGCELLKNLALMGFGQLEVIDMDTIELSNLNRQFLFTERDIGKSKAIIAADAIRKRCPHISIIPHYARIQDYTLDFYEKFDLIICGLDSIEARRWMNAMLFQIVQRRPEQQPIPMLDGGTEGLKGHIRVIIPHKTACFECSLDAFPPQVAHPICTLANTPRQPEHCVEWAFLLEWPRLHPDTSPDTDSPEHLQEIYEMAAMRADAFQIAGVTYHLTQGIVKRIIPAIASTNAIIAAIAANEAFKMATGASPILRNYMMMNGTSGIYTYTFEYERKPDCLICGQKSITFPCPKETLLREVLDQLVEDQRFRLKKPSVRTVSGLSLYMQAPPVLEETSRPNLDLSLGELFNDEIETTCIITDPALPNPIVLKFLLGS